MSMLRKVIKAKRESSKQFAKFRKVAKAITATIDTTDSCKCATRPGYFWVKEYGQQGGYFQAFNTGVQDRVGMPVLTGIEPQTPFRRVIFSIDWGEVPLIFDDDDIPPGAYDLPAHAASHEWSDADPGTDIVNVYQRAIVPLRAQYTDGMKLQVAPAIYFDNDDLKMFMGQEVTVVSYVPSSAGNHKRVLLYLNPDTNSVQVQDQTEVDDGDEAIYDDPPAGTLPVAWVYLQYGDTSLVDADITDARAFLNASLETVDLDQLLTVEHHLEIDYNKRFDVTVGGGGALTVEEQDTAPSVANVTKMKVTNGSLTDDGGGVVSLVTGGGGGGAPIGATYIVQTANPILTNEQVLSVLATGIVKNTTATGVLSIAIEGTDYYGPAGTDVPITDGGTGASDAATARTNLGVAIGTDVQAYDAELAALAGLVSAADKLPYFTGVEAAAVTDFTAFARSILDDADEATFKATVNLEIGTDVLAEQTIGIADNNLLEVDGSPNDDEYARFTANGLEGRTEAEFKGDFNLEIGTDVQAYDAELAALAGLVSAADKLPYFTGVETASLTDLTLAGRAILDDADASAQRTTLGVAIGSDVQAYDVGLADIAGLAVADGNFIVGDGANWVAENGAAARTSLGLGSIATQAANNVSITGGAISGITDLAVADGGTGQSAQQAAINALTAVGGATNEHVLTKDTGTGNAIFKVSTGGGAPTDAQYVTLALDGGLSDERVLIGTANQIVITDGGANGNVTLSTPQDIHTGATPVFAGLTINGNIVATGDIHTVPWTDYFGSSTITGWSGYTTSKIMYKQVGKLVFCQFELTGTSDSAAARFTLPTAMQSDVQLQGTMRIQNDGTWQLGMIYVVAGSNTINFYTSLTGSAWTTSGDKSIVGEFWYEID